MNASQVNETSRAPACKPASRSFRLGYRPCLDGLRGVSILAVIAVHAMVLNNRAAFIGVNLFFVLSGFLITCLLLAEWDQLGAISLKRFYARRALRLLPALALVLLACVTYHWLVSSPATAATVAGDALIALFYSSNWTLGLGYRRPDLLGHTWSLSIEEQFYLCWPLLLIFLLRRTSTRSSLLRWVVLGLVLVVVNRLVQIVAGANYYRILYGTDTRADSLLLGCLVAVGLSARVLTDSGPTRRAIKYLAYLSVLGLGLLSLYQDFGYEFDLSVVYLVIPLLGAVILLHVLLPDAGLLSRALSQPWLVYIGKLSYGLYLWHYPIFRQTQAAHWPRAQELAVELGLTAVATLGSFYLLERPMLRIKRKLARSDNASARPFSP